MLARLDPGVVLGPGGVAAEGPPDAAGGGGAAGDAGVRAGAPPLDEGVGANSFAFGLKVNDLAFALSVDLTTAGDGAPAAAPVFGGPAGVAGEGGAPRGSRAPSAAGPVGVPCLRAPPPSFPFAGLALPSAPKQQRENSDK